MTRSCPVFVTLLLFALVLSGCGKPQDQTTEPQAGPSSDTRPDPLAERGRPPGTFDPSSPSSAEGPEPSETDRLAAELAAVLEKAYAASSSEQLEAFFQKWHDSFAPRNLSTITDPLEKELYDVYRAFFDPFHPSRPGGSRWLSEFYSGVRYVIVQNSMTYETDQKGREHEITDFRPPLKFKNAEVLFLTPAYREALIRFLGTEHDPMGTGNLMAPARASGESRKRLEFIKPYVRILHGHWFGWHVCTHPMVGRVAFNADRTRATMGVVRRYQGGFAELKKKQGRWTVEKVQMTVIW